MNTKLILLGLAGLAAGLVIAGYRAQLASNAVNGTTGTHDMLVP